MCNNPKIRIVWDENFRKEVPSFYYKYKKNVFRKGVFLDKENPIDMQYLAKIQLSNLSHHIQYVPCHKCAGCAASWSQQWTARCMLESRRFKLNSYITLTYNDDFLPEDSLLQYEDFQKFIKRLRKKVSSRNEISPRYFMCGEYGTKNHRPHYHSLLFGYFPSDAKLWYWTNGKIKKPNHFKGAYPVYLSKELQDLWSLYQKENGEEVLKPIGHVLLCEVNYASIKYVANYQLKWKPEFYSYNINPFNHQSTRPALARTYYDENFLSIIANESLPSGLGLRVKRIKYFDNLLQRDYPEYYIPLQEELVARAKAVVYDTTLPYFEYLKVRENNMQKRMLSKHRD